jgi:hypothetical protein
VRCERHYKVVVIDLMDLGRMMCRCLPQVQSDLWQLISLVSDYVDVSWVRAYL